MRARINERYTVLRCLGRGAQGMVLEVEDSAFPTRPTALKIISGANPDALLLFEFEQLTRLEHPHLVLVHDLGRVTAFEGVLEDGSEIPAGAAFFTQELVDGGPCHEWIERLPRGERPLAALLVCVAAARALALIHERGLMHRDVKPSNILVSTDGREIKLIDFGLSRLTGVPDGLRAGTLGFIAPEALQGYPDQRSDLYGLGATLGFLLTGRTPRPGAGFADEDASLPPTDASAAPRGAWKVARRLTRPRPEDRLQTAREAILAMGRVAPAAMGDTNRRDLLDAASDHEDLRSRATRFRSAELVGRDAKLERVGAWIETAASGRGEGGVLVIHGPPGSGKTRLARAAAVRAQLGIAGAGGVPPSFLAGSLEELVRALGRQKPVAEDKATSSQLASWLGDPRAVDRGEGAPAGLVCGIADLLSTTDLDAILLVERVCDDLAEAVLRRLAACPRAGLAVIAELCDETRAQDLIATAGLEAVEVEPLDPAREAKLVRAILGRDVEDDGFLARLHELTGGLPALTVQVLAGLSPGSLGVQSLADLERGGIVEVGLARWLLPRLSGTGRRLAAALAVLGDAATVSTVLAVAGLDSALEKDGLDGLGELDRRGLLTWDAAGQVRLSSFAAREIGAALEGGEARRLHRRALAALDRVGVGDPSRLARHAAGAGLRARARTMLRQAADRLMTAGDPGAAIQRLQQLLELPGASRSQRIRAGIDLARLARQTGHYDLAAAALDALEHHGLGAHADRARFERAALLRLTGRPDLARRLLGERGAGAQESLEVLALRARLALDDGDLEGASAAVGPSDELPEPQSTRAGLTGVAGLLELTRDDLPAADRVLRRGLAAAEEDGDLLQRARFESLLGMVAHRRGDFSEAAARYRSALDLAVATGDDHGQATYAANLAAALTELDDIAGALAAYRRGIELLERVGRGAELATTGANLAELLLRVGDIPAALAASARALESARACGDRGAILAAGCVHGEALLMAGDADRSLEVLESAGGDFDGVLPESRAALARHRAAALLARGAVDEARRILDDPGLRDNSWHHAQLTCEAALAAGAVPPLALEELLRRLPGPGEPRGSLHLRPMLIAARAAAATPEPDLARQLAREALSLLAGVRQLTPSLHRPEEDPMKRELEELSGGRDQARSGFGALGDDWAWERLARINTRLNSEQRIGALLDLIMDTAIEITGAERGFLLVVDRRGRLGVRCARNIDRRRLMTDDQDYSRGVAQAAFASGEPVITTDAQADARFCDYRSVLALDLRYVLAVPLKVRGQTSGAIYVDSRSGARFDERRLALVRALADQAAIALENARMTAELRRRQRRIEKQSRQLEQRLRERELELERVRRDLERQGGEATRGYGEVGIIGRSAAMERVFALLDRVSRSELPVVITGESGTGKELVARALHAGGPRRDRPFVAESCAAIPEALLESVLFGHARGAFTGAVRDNPGLFVEADGGTLFLDELGDLPLALQAKLLRVLQEGELRPLGGTRLVQVDVRILAAANTDLEELVRGGRLRADLFYRLNVIKVRLPPLRERREDIPLLAAHFAAKHRPDSPPRLTGAAIEALTAHPWPGNVRQLENEILRALVSAGEEVDLVHLSDELIGGAGEDIADDMHDLELEPRVERLKARLIAAALERAGGNRTRAASLLGISRYGLQKMLARLGD